MKGNYLFNLQERAKWENGAPLVFQQFTHKYYRQKEVTYKCHQYIEYDFKTQRRRTKFVS